MEQVFEERAPPTDFMFDVRCRIYDVVTKMGTEASRKRQRPEALKASRMRELPVLVIGHSETEHQHEKIIQRKMLGELASWRLGELHANGSSTTKNHGSKTGSPPLPAFVTHGKRITRLDSNL
jgi:hypothetical protein